MSQCTIIKFSSTYNIKELPNLQGFLSRAFNEEKADFVIFSGTVEEALNSGLCVWEKPAGLKESSSSSSEEGGNQGLMMVYCPSDDGVPLLYLQNMKVDNGQPFVRLMMLRTQEAENEEEEGEEKEDKSTECRADKAQKEEGEQQEYQELLDSILLNNNFIPGTKGVVFGV